MSEDNERELSGLRSEIDDLFKKLTEAKKEIIELKRKIPSNWAVIESGTCAMDGWYNDFESAVSAREYWDKERPGREHKLVAGVPDQPWPLGDNAYDAPETPWRFLADMEIIESEERGEAGMNEAFEKDD